MNVVEAGEVRLSRGNVAALSLDCFVERVDRGRLRGELGLSETAYRWVKAFGADSTEVADHFGGCTTLSPTLAPAFASNLSHTSVAAFLLWIAVCRAMAVRDQGAGPGRAAASPSWRPNATSSSSSPATRPPC